VRRSRNACCSCTRAHIRARGGSVRHLGIHTRRQGLRGMLSVWMVLTQAVQANLQTITGITCSQCFDTWVAVRARKEGREGRQSRRQQSCDCRPRCEVCSNYRLRFRQSLRG
jgi:hypothetical protein